MRRLPMRAASSACPMALLILCAPVWVRSSRFRKMRVRSDAFVLAACLAHRTELELLDRLDQRLGDVAPAELAEVTARVRIAS